MYPDTSLSKHKSTQAHQILATKVPSTHGHGTVQARSSRRKRETGGGFLCTTNGGQLDSPGRRLLINPMPASKSTNIGGEDPYKYWR